VGISQILSPVSSGFTEEHASLSGPQWRATLPAVFRHQRNRPTLRALAWRSQLQSTSPAASFVHHLKNQPFRAWQYIYMGVFSHADTDNPTQLCGNEYKLQYWQRLSLPETQPVGPRTLLWPVQTVHFCPWIPGLHTQRPVICSQSSRTDPNSEHPHAENSKKRTFQQY
jgi:hypothetical protein